MQKSTISTADTATDSIANAISEAVHKLGWGLVAWNVALVGVMLAQFTS
jgi:hypothetical protein